MRNIITGIGTVIFLLGMMAGESKNLLYPLAMILIGGAIVLISMEKGPQAYT